MDGSPIVLVMLLIWLVCSPILIGVFFALTLWKLLKLCAPESRTIRPGSVWWLLVPLVNLVVQFFVVLRIETTLANEFRRRQLPAERSTRKEVGLAWCISTAATLVPGIGPLALVVGLVCWMLYWIAIARLVSVLESVPGAATPAAPAAPPGSPPPPPMT